MSYVASNSNGPTYEYPLVEQNAERHSRAVTIKYRKVLGKRGWMLRRVGRHLGAPDTPEGMAHAALMVGDYVHELHTDEANQKYLVAQRLTGHQIWPSTVGENIKGYTTMTDQEIADTGTAYLDHVGNLPVLTTIQQCECSRGCAGASAANTMLEGTTAIISSTSCFAESAQAMIKFTCSTTTRTRAGRTGLAVPPHLKWEQA